MDWLRCISPMTVGWCLRCPIDYIFDRPPLACSKSRGRARLSRLEASRWLDQLLGTICHSNSAVWTHPSSHLHRSIRHIWYPSSIYWTAHLRRLVNLRYINWLIDYIVYCIQIVCVCCWCVEVNPSMSELFEQMNNLFFQHLRQICQ